MKLTMSGAHKMNNHIKNDLFSENNSILNKNFLFMQGPISPFYNELAYQLNKVNGANVAKIQLCHSDKLWWDFDLIPYTGLQDCFSDFIHNILKDMKITTIILLGDCREYHKIAVTQARKLNIEVWIFEEGYLRPDTITLEYNSGANKNSSIPKNQEFYLKYKSRQASEILIKIKSSLSIRLLWDSKYHLLNFINKRKFPNYVHHRVAKILAEYLAWGRRFSIKIFTDKITLPNKIKKINASKFFLVPLQLSHDFQITLHSKYDSTFDMITEVLDSFKSYDNKDVKLVFKMHPLDTALENPFKHIKKYIKDHPEMKKRVIIIDGGHLPTMIDSSEGVIVINSTVGLQALNHKVATKALGDAIYDFEGMTDQQLLRDFWSNPQKPNHNVVKTFRKYLLENRLVNGGFYSEHAINIAAPLAARHIYRGE